MKAIIPVFLILVLFATACTPVAKVAPAPVIEEPTKIITALPTSTPTSTVQPVATWTATATAEIVPILDSIRRTPPTLMLHRPNLQFDSLAFLKEFVEILKQNNMRVVTYRDIHKSPEITATEYGKLFIITIDDINLAYPMDRRVVEMIDVLEEAGYPAVLGIVTATEYTDSETTARLKRLTALGWEIASHTDTHANLGKLEAASEKLVIQEVLPSLDKIEKAVGIRPITLILPEGQMVNDIRILQGMDLYWIVGINGGVTYDSRKSIIYVGREGPAKNADYTYKILKLRFGF